MFELAFDCNCIEAFLDGVGAADELDPILLLDLVLDDRRGAKETNAGLAKNLQEGTVIEFAADNGLNLE